MDDPVMACKDFDQENAALDFTGLEFIQVDDNEFIMNGSFSIHRDVIGKVPVSGFFCYFSMRISRII